MHLDTDGGIDADARNRRHCADLISFIPSLGGEASGRHTANVMRDGSGLRRKVFGFNSRDVGAKSRGNRGGDRDGPRLLEGNAGSDGAGCSLVFPVTPRRNQTSLRRDLRISLGVWKFQTSILVLWAEPENGV